MFSAMLPNLQIKTRFTHGMTKRTIQKANLNSLFKLLEHGNERYFGFYLFIYFYVSAINKLILIYLWSVWVWNLEDTVWTQLEEHDLFLLYLIFTLLKIVLMK